MDNEEKKRHQVHDFLMRTHDADGKGIWKESADYPEGVTLSNGKFFDPAKAELFAVKEPITPAFDRIVFHDTCMYTPEELNSPLLVPFLYDGIEREHDSHTGIVTYYKSSDQGDGKRVQCNEYHDKIGILCIIMDQEIRTHIVRAIIQAGRNSSSQHEL